MKFQQKIKIIKILIVISILGILVITYSSLSHRKDEGRISKELRSLSKLPQGKGIYFVGYQGNNKIYAVSIDSFSIERVRLGPFAIGPLNAAHLNKINVDLYLDEMESSLNVKESKGKEESPIDFEAPISNIKKNLPIQSKHIKGIKLKDISINLWRDGKRIFRISSDRATADRKTEDLIFMGHAIMDANEKGNLKSYRIKWNKKTHLFRVTDSYILTKGNSRREGKGIETDYLFRQIKYQSSNKSNSLN
jgi:hypothetical protein